MRKIPHTYRGYRYKGTHTGKFRTHIAVIDTREPIPYSGYRYSAADCHFLHTHMGVIGTAELVLFLCPYEVVLWLISKRQ